jgi:hypothetical protein
MLSSLDTPVRDRQEGMDRETELDIIRRASTEQPTAAPPHRVAGGAMLHSGRELARQPMLFVA